MSYQAGDRVRAKKKIGPVAKGTKGVVQADSQPGNTSVLVQFVGEPGPIDAPVTSIEPDTSASGGASAGVTLAAMAVVYVVANHSRQQIYVGMEPDFAREWRDHCRGSAILPGWQHERDDLQLLASFRRRPEQARSLARELAQGGARLRTYCLEAAEWEDEGYRVTSRLSG